MAFRKVLLYGAASGVGLYTSTLAYFKFTTGVCKSDRNLEGKTVIVTGANTGIGLETARDLAARNARVILACRSLSKGEEAAKDIIESTGNTNVVLKQVDVSSFQSVREFAKDILETEKRVDILINNAGVMMLPEPQKSADGHGMIMATNHFGPFLLTNLLLPKLKESSPARIVMVSSLAHEWAKNVDVEQMQGEKQCKKRFSTYGRSKLANVLFTRELSERLKDTGVTINAVHPGAVKTELSRHMNSNFDLVLRALFQPFLKSSKQGAQTSIYVAVADELEGVSGKYFSDCKEKELKKHARNEKMAKKLWELSEEITGLKTA